MLKPEREIVVTDAMRYSDTNPDGDREVCLSGTMSASHVPGQSFEYTASRSIRLSVARLDPSTGLIPNFHSALPAPSSPAAMIFVRASPANMSGLTAL